jgi:hypothetical protein
MKNIKKMKNIYLIAALVITASCTDLEPEMYSDMTTSNAYSTESDINAALVGIYADIAPFPGDGWMYYNGYLIMTTDYTTDIGFSTAAGDPTKLSNFTYDANNRYFKYNWRYMFEVISNANMLISKIDAIDMDDTKKKQIIAQARFLRALAYRDATDAWGPVPLIIDVIDPTATYDMPLSPVSEIDAEVIIKDCKYAIENLPKSWSIDEGLSRATKGAAAMLLAKDYMRAHDYANAKTYIDMILQLRNEGVYTLNPDFKDVWSESNKKDDGMIFCILHEASQNGGEITNHFGPRDHPDMAKWQYYAVSLYFWRNYNDADPRKEFFYYNYEGRSPRDNTTTRGFFYLMPDEGQTVPPSDTVKLLQNVATMKYSYEMVNPSYYDGRTIPVFRLADAILCKAEIENELSGPSAALPYLNEVRARAGAPIYGDAGFPVPGSKEEMAEKILDERGYELVFEYKRRPDLIRFGKYEEVCNTYLQSRGLAPVVNKNMELFPYPLVDAQLNSNMASENISRLP